MSNFITELRSGNEADSEVEPMPLLPKQAENRDVLKVLKPLKKAHEGGKVTWDWFPIGGQAHMKPFQHFGWLSMPEGAGGTGLHPHSGLELVTVLTEGSYRHESRGLATHVLLQGSVEYQMTGSGIWHQEHTLARGGFKAYQLTLQLPAASCKAPPQYQAYPSESLPHERKPDYDLAILVGGLSPVKTLNRFTFLEIRVDPDRKVHLPAVLGRQAFVCVTEGAGHFGGNRAFLSAEDMGMLGPGEGVTVQSTSMGVRLFLANGEPA
jgi:redox-sensitive bicupin YhaK (pirin superfamily)